MKIAILGTRGIPNKYGGFEQFAENLSTQLVQRGHRVIVYSPHFHDSNEPLYKGVEIIKINSPEKFLHGAANFVYDNRCIDNVMNQDIDIALVCGYASSVFSSKKMSKSKKPIFVVNVDGLEWARPKWSFITKKMIRWAEKRIAKSNIHLVTDHQIIKEYYHNTYKVDSSYISYGADVPINFDESALLKYNLNPQKYMLAISRIEPDNNIELIINGFLLSKTDNPLVIVGNCNTKFGKILTKKYASFNSIKFIGSVFEKPILDNLRYYSNIYFHGHSVGGTNPSLLEAMACGTYIVSHDNIYNRAIIESNGAFFKSPSNISQIINNPKAIEDQRSSFGELNIQKIKNEFSWKKIVDEYENLFFRLSNTQKAV
ncbi:MAG TPA: glycosyl transferase [Bacteroidales bacterium]|nr:MAG: hypothetical protein A2W98_12990 [Bacteroidetes bacterium GWF2_33_38]OFY76005.1 MAG: hypothetical protein A2265_08085 [Bacteroidetes bacterium RIFOXYA12_FULL_33_9]HBF87652.1 glycosyl transferase [Bacteroidales bacterium]